MADILSIRRETLSNQSINQFVNAIFIHRLMLGSFQIRKNKGFEVKTIFKIMIF